MKGTVGDIELPPSVRERAIAHIDYASVLWKKKHYSTSTRNLICALEKFHRRDLNDMEEYLKRR
jgi:hypothetical protein